MNDTEITSLTHSVFEMRIIGGRKFIAIRQHDSESSGWHVVDQFGRNYGAWESVASFASAYVAKKTGDTSKLQAEVFGLARLSLRHLS